MTSFKWADDGSRPSLSSKFILSDERRPRLSEVLHSDSIPVIDMAREDEKELVDKVARACQEYGFFQVVNHGVPEELYKKAMEAMTAFFLLEPEEKGCFAEAPGTKRKDMKVFGYYLKERKEDDKVHLWSEIVAHPWHPSDPTFSLALPLNPPQYREVMLSYSKEMNGLFSRLLGLLSLGLGLQQKAIEERLGDAPTRRVQLNYYPPCPDPELTLGLAAHCDYQALTIVQPCDRVPGLQVLKDGHWLAVDPIPNSYVINVGDMMQVLSNGRYRSVRHRAVTNRDETRISMAFFYGPNENAVIKPLEGLVDEVTNPPLYREFVFKEFVNEFENREGKEKRLLQEFQVSN